MSGLFYGNKYHLPKKKKQGILYMPNIKKYLVRVKIPMNKKRPKVQVVSTIAKCNTKKEAQKIYNKHLRKYANF